MSRKPTPLRRKVLLALCSPLVALLLLEGALRCFGYPTGRFAVLLPATVRPYPQSTTVEMNWGPIPYSVRSNSLGLRGEEIPFLKAAATLRIVTVGDSATDGFFVDNEATWQYVLEDLLQRDLARDVEVVNCARGGGSIDKELFLLRQFGLPLQPDVVILTFVSNDIADILGRSAAEMAAFWSNAEALQRSLAPSFALTRTAIGEALFELYLAIRSPVHGRRDQAPRGTRGDGRYDIEGGGDFARNAAEFSKRLADTDGLVLGDAFTPAVQDALDVYGRILAEFTAACRESGARIVFVYFPAYPQIYADPPPLRINATLRQLCQRLQVEFLDLTDGFRAGRDRVLHLAPLDFHLNPEGNRLFARLLAAYFASGAAAGGRPGGGK
jgi:lysophospholipase L1-like esterase